MGDVEVSHKCLPLLDRQQLGTSHVLAAQEVLKSPRGQEVSTVANILLDLRKPGEAAKKDA